MSWKLKVSEDGHAVLVEGKPVYIDPDGKEVPLDPPSMYGKIIDLGKENKKRREDFEGVQAKLKLFDGVEDLEAWHAEAVKALETIKNFDEKDWLKAEKVEKLKADMKSAYEEQERKLRDQFKNRETEFAGLLGKKEDQIRKLMVSNRFATSPYFSGTNPKTSLPPEIAETYFGQHFKVEEDKKTGELRLVAYYRNGDPIYSRTNPGEFASFDEAMTTIWDQYPGRDRLVRGQQGSGGQGGKGGAGDTGDELAELEKAYAEAMKNKNTAQMLVLKNKIFTLRQKKAAA